MNHHCIMTSSNGNIFHVTGPLCGEFTSEFPTQRPVMRSFDVLFDLHLNKRLSKQCWGWWFETPSPSLWCHCSGKLILMVPKCCECSNSWWNQVGWNGTMILVPYHVVKHLQLLSEDQGWGAVSDLSMISDLSQKFKHDLWRVKSELKLSRKQHLTPGTCRFRNWAPVDFIYGCPIQGCQLLKYFFRILLKKFPYFE